MTWHSKICECGHSFSEHYKKNYLGDQMRDWEYGNLDFHGCDGCEKEGKPTCKQFKGKLISREQWHVENNLVAWLEWEKKHPNLSTNVEPAPR